MWALSCNFFGYFLPFANKQLLVQWAWQAMEPAEVIVNRMSQLVKPQTPTTVILCSLSFKQPTQWSLERFDCVFMNFHHPTNETVWLTITG